MAPSLSLATSLLLAVATALLFAAATSAEPDPTCPLPCQRRCRDLTLCCDIGTFCGTGNNDCADGSCCADVKCPKFTGSRYRTKSDSAACGAIVTLPPGTSLNLTYDATDAAGCTLTLALTASGVAASGLVDSDGSVCLLASAVGDSSDYYGAQLYGTLVSGRIAAITAWPHQSYTKCTFDVRAANAASSMRCTTVAAVSAAVAAAFVWWL